MKLHFSAVAAFVFGVATGGLQLAYLGGRVPALSDLSAETPTIYVISITFFTWIVLTIVAFARHGRGVIWILIVAPFALIGPAAFAHLIFHCMFYGCDL